MWKEKIIAKTETAIRFRITQAEQLLSFQEVFDLWQHSPDFRSFYIHLLTQNTLSTSLNYLKINNSIISIAAVRPFFWIKSLGVSSPTS